VCHALRIVPRTLRARTFSFNRASLTGFDFGVGRGGADALSSGMVSSCIVGLSVRGG